MKKSELRQLIREEIKATVTVKQYSVTIRTEYGKLYEITVSAKDESDAFDKALQKAEEAVWTSKLDQIELIS